MKQLTRIKILSVVLILLGIAAFFSIQKKYSTDTITKKENKINVDTSLVTKILITKEGVQKVLQKSSGNNWKVNGKYIVRQNIIDLLLTGLSRLEIKRPVAEENKKKVRELLMSKGALLNIDMGEGKKTLRFASNEKDINSTYLLIENSDEPYIAYVPGVPGDINTIFKMEESDLRSRDLFQSTPMTLEKILISYPQNMNENIEVARGERELVLKNVDNYDTAKFYKYLEFYSYMPVSGYLNSKVDSIASKINKNSLFATIEVKDLDETKSHILSVYADSKNKRFYYGKIEKTGETVLLNKELYDRLLVRKSFFIKR